RSARRRIPAARPLVRRAERSFGRAFPTDQSDRARTGRVRGCGGRQNARACGVGGVTDGENRYERDGRHMAFDVENGLACWRCSQSWSDLPYCATEWVAVPDGDGGSCLVCPGCVTLDESTALKRGLRWTS